MAVMEKSKNGPALLGKDGNALVSLVIINVVVFALIKFIEIIFHFSKLDVLVYNQTILSRFTLTSDAKNLLSSPWTVFTYMFVHNSLIGMLGNMMWLWAFGYILQDLAGNKKIIPIYIYGGVIGAMFFIAAHYIVPSSYNGVYYILGAGVPLMAVSIAATALSPKYRIFPFLGGGIPLWVVTSIFILINILMNFNIYTLIASVGAGIMGLIFINRLQSGYDLGKWMGSFYDWISKIFDPVKKNSHISTMRQKELFYNTKGKPPYKKIPNVNQQKIDAILDKINSKGYNFLSEEEKDYLKRASKDL